ncbi:hypothetical protein [Amycolatopsis sp. SID8362]|uniref:hypothetical protein n=1 Tax=Amycolatopsis sp. SID8362 TaxID=2690346 RepID=UPI0013689C48|nr:hypothetical protein [Amycolatopsis sp. SID8362]NBH10026.1 hypothetical protein [Amycolatopsis sp. SID8362]NED46720.1 hypothetical protein [Amycolatopsis sp. SID8362]
MIALTPLDEPALARLLEFHRGRSLDPATAVERTWVVDAAAPRWEPAGRNATATR